MIKSEVVAGMEVYKSESCLIGYSSEEARLLLQCRRAMRSHEFRQGLMKALQFAREQHVKQWLLDLREIGELEEADETWVQVQLFPQIMMYLGTGNYMAVVMAESCYQNRLLESGLLGLRSYNSFVIINTFCQVQEAVDWLDRKQTGSAG